MNKNVSREFYNDLRFSKKSELDIYETIEEITDNDLVKLKALLNDLEWFLVKDINSPVLFDPVRNLDEEEKEWEERTYSIKWQGEEICKIKKPVTREGSNILQPLLDYETLPDAEYIPVCQIINLLQRRIRELQDKDQHNKSNKNIKTKGLSVPDWTIIFYYLYGAEGKKGTIFKEIKKFIEDHDIDTTFKRFKKEYYTIVRRINRTEDSNGKTLPPLPPERIKKILHFFKNNTKAKKRAENDIVYLTDEAQKHNDNDY